ncbi:MAG: hypothetical protein IJP81_10550 [Bacteroidales bacterium]|nr:hypothetical protein [Bacteroidales bacterium]
MRKTLLIALAALLSFPVWCQSIRTNYRSEGMTHISTDYEPLTLGGIPAQLRVELVGFPDGSTLYLLYINLVQKEAVVVPKGVKMAVTLANGKLIRLEQINQVSSTPNRLEDGTILNRLKYATEPADMEKMVKGIKSVELVTGWNPDDFVSARFSEDQMGALLKRHCEAILNASSKTIDLQSNLSGYTENANSIMSTADPIVARGSRFDYNILLSHLYYKNTNGEDMDLAFVIGTQEQFFIPYDSSVRFTLADGSLISLLQAREDTNFVYLYPSMEDLARMCEVGITGLAIDYKGGTLEDSFPAGEEKNGFSDAINQQVQLLLSLSPR